MRNHYVDHDFDAIGSENVGQGITLAKVRCRKCGEERRVGASIAEVNLTGGCLRKGPDKPWRRGDCLVREGVYLDWYEKTLPSGRILTYNLGGHWHDSDPMDVRPQADIKEEAR